MDINDFHSAFSASQSYAEQSRNMLKEELRYQEEVNRAERQLSANISQARALTQQVELLKQQNVQLKELLDRAKADSLDNQRIARKNLIFGWVSFAIGTLIGIVGVICGIIW